MSANLPELGRDGRARAVSLAARQRPEAEPTSLVSYQSHGRLVVIGSEEAAAAAAGRVGESLSCTLVVPGPGQPEPGRAGGQLVIRGGRPLVAGHLGRFTVNLEGPAGTVSLAEAAGAATPHYDLVLDLSEPPVLDHDIPPVGYFAPAGKFGALERAVAELVELKGEFEKPKYFAFDPELCAHGRSGLTGCTRCLDACPTRAITSAGDVVAVDPYLCQGAGSCVAACPSGAMSYAFPKASNLLTHLQGLLEDYRAAGGEGGVLLLHDGWSGVAIRERHAAAMPENVIPVEVEEIGSTGIDTWLSALAYGARGVRLAVTKGTPARVTGELGAQAGFATSLLAGMGYSGEAIAVVECDAEDLSAAWAGLPDAEIDRPARFAAPDDKRGLLRLAIEHLYRQAPEPKKSVELPAGAPFGEIRVARDACTLCMGCVSVCPAGALAAGGDLPQLRFTEWNCVQCGLCESACPEDAIALHPRFLFDAEARQQPRILHEEPPFCCITCGKPFATQAMLDTLARKLEGHWMFQTEEARRRLQMCDHCRVQDMFRSERKQRVPQ
jgi:ferredoxin